MVVKKIHLYALSILLFIACFVALNKKYDPFYRVNGINNDNRALIEKYLDSKQQAYLIDNAIAVNLFIKYIEVPGFRLENYQFYNLLDKARLFPDVASLITNTNAIAIRLSIAFGDKAYQYCESLVSDNLVLAYLEKASFTFQNSNYYQIVRALYDNDDYQYIDHANTYALKLQNYNITSAKEKEETLKTLVNNYDKNSLHMLLTTPLQEGTTIVFQPRKNNVVIDQNHFIGSYEPNNIVEVLDISRSTYSSMYLDEGAYQSLKRMYKDLQAACGTGVILKKAYRNYSILSLHEDPTTLEKAGYSEFQLGTTVAFQHLNYSNEDFSRTDSYRWLLDNSYRYGYILRYPIDKETITHKPYQNNIFRYVGEPLAATLHAHNWTLEEYNMQPTNQIEAIGE